MKGQKLVVNLNSDDAENDTSQEKLVYNKKDTGYSLKDSNTMQ